MCSLWRAVVGGTVAIVAVAIVATSFGAVIDEPPGFSYAEFRVNEAVAMWLLVYDRMAWHSSDVVIQESQEELNKLGSEWFCLESGGLWHAFYGRYDPAAETYHVVFHYVYHENTGFISTDETIDESTLATYGRALHNSLIRLPESITSLDVRFNLYIRSLGDGTLEVWILPAGQPDGTLVYGGDIHYVLDSTGSEFLDEQLNFTRFYAIRPAPDLELDIDREENDVPSVGDIFFLLSFRDQFEDVAVWTRCFRTNMLDVEGQESSWLHVERPGIDCTGKSEKQPKEDADQLD